MSKHDKDTAAGLLLAFKFIHQMQMSGKLGKGKFLDLAKKANPQLPTDLRYTTETRVPSASPLCSTHKLHDNRGLIIINPQINCMATLSIMNRIQHICTCGLHIPPRVFGSCVQHLHATSHHHFCSLCSFLPFFLLEYMTVKVRNKAEAASLICIHFGGQV